ncbi:hypothetical protein AK812_SmicGene16916 [Symbiodinium microadriaticum]|uniref:Tyrosinase copper-binding domain-containing protein n=1 Tax=Symbiodinium microadriaticum TaxID=2951 RepID=A0A1Q9DZ23_SYMMI|nr:hypothetical protein AK812_SmicGene16916 [Symbiodinium microadriaticum]
MSLFQMQPLPSTDEEQPGPSSGLGHQQRPHCRRILTGTGLLVVLGLCWVALQKSPEFLARRFGAPSLVEGQPEAQEAWGMGKVWQWHKDRLEAYKIHKKTNWDGEQQKTANARWEVFDGKKIRSIGSRTDTDMPPKKKARNGQLLKDLLDDSEHLKAVKEEFGQCVVTVADAFWKVKTLTEAEGQALYGPNFHNHDDMLMLHSCATTDPRCDQGHFGPQFMTFHRALLLKYELALLAVDPSIEAMPYWNMAYDAQGGKYEMDPIKGIFTNNYFGDYYGNMGMANYQVTNGLFANWPIAHWTSERFGSESHMAKGNPCIEKEYFTGTTASVCDRCCMDTTGTCECDEETDTYSTFLRAHDDCTPWVARWPEDPDCIEMSTFMCSQRFKRISVEPGPRAKGLESADGLGKLGGTWKLVYNEEDFNNCTDIKQFFLAVAGSQRFKRISVEPGFLSTFRQLILPQMQKRADAISEDTEYGKYVRKAVRKLTDTAEQESQYSDAFTSVLQEIMKQLCGDYMLFGFIRDRIHLGKQQTPIYPRFFHSQAHIKFGKDLLDVTTSPNEAAAFTGYHSDIDRSSMTWMMVI